MDATIALILIEALLILLGIAFYKATSIISPSPHVTHPVAVGDSCSNDVVSISTVSSPSAHIIVAPPATKYDVFLSFRGEDTRDNFTSHLYEALCKENIKTFRDHKISKGEHISPILSKTIEASEIYVIIFSKNFASSTWCMNELVHILKSMDKFGRVVIPIFYNVDPSNIGKQNGSFGDGFGKLMQRFKDDQQQVLKWRNALIQSSKLCGWDSKNIRPESELIKEIVKDIFSKLNRKPSCPFEGLVGIDHRIESIEKLLSEARIVGIWGMGGAGKTTLAKAIFQKLEAKFEAFSFVENVREQLARIGLDKLQEKCLKELLKDEDINIYGIKSPFVKSRLQSKKVLLILDDVDNSIIVEDLTKVCGWFGEGSRIIITSRDMQVLKNASASATYHVPELNFHDAFHLFSLKAFKQNEPFRSYMELSEWVVDYCQGNPLALVVLGCFLHGRGKEEWESALEKLNQAPHNDIFNVLKLSFDGLDDNQKNVFLDLAFVIKEVGVISVDQIRHFYDTSIHIEISVLKERSLISVDASGGIEMHHLVRKMGLEVARKQLSLGPVNPIRLWRHEDIDYFVICNKGIEAIRCISMDISKTKRITLTASDFRKMHNLIFLKVYKSNKEKPSKLNICEDLDYLPEELRFLHWEEYPLPYVPLSFCAENLIHLNMRHSHLRQLWEGTQYFPNLQSIDLSFSKYLITLPDLSQFPNIEDIYLHGCVNLAQIQSSTILDKIKHLYLEHYEEARHMNIGGTMKERSSGLATVHNYLDLKKFSLNKVTMKVFVSDNGNIISGYRLKHAVVPSIIIEDANLKLGTQSLVSLLPFVSKVCWINSIEFGNFNQHFDYHHDDFLRYNISGVVVKRRVESGVVGPLRREGVNVHVEENEEGTTSQLEDQELEEELMGQVLECCDSNTLTISVPYNITRWSLLTQLRLKESDIIGSAGGSIPQVSVLKSVVQSHYCKRQLQPPLHQKLSLFVPLPADGGPQHYFDIFHFPGWSVLPKGSLGITLRKRKYDNDVTIISVVNIR